MSTFLSRLLAATIGILLSSSCDSRNGEADNITPDDPIEVEESSALPEGFVRLTGEVTYTLEDGEERGRQHPETFEIPARQRRENLLPGEIVKLIFAISDGTSTQTERMWVIVEGGDATGYTGTLDNDPVSTDRIKAGLKVAFEPRHVISIFTDESASPLEPGSGAEEETIEEGSRSLPKDSEPPS